MSQIQVDNIYNKEATGGPNFPLGANVTGVITATTFKGGAEITSGTISATSITAASGTFTGPVTIGGTLTYEDVTNIDSVGVVTARSGIDITGASAGVNGSSNLILKTGGTERIRILSDGKTGIGTSPYGSSARLQVYEPTLDRALILDSGSANGPHMRLWRQGVVQHYIGCSAGFGQGNYEDLGVRAKDNIIFHPGDSSTERLRIGAAGQIGLSGANYGTTGQVLTSQGSGSAVQWATVAAGMSEYDQWTVTVNTNSGSNINGWTESKPWGGSTTPATVNLARTTTTQNPLFAKIGTGVSKDSNGYWTFPSTGYWEVRFLGMMQAQYSMRMVFPYIRVTTDGGSSWNTVAKDFMRSLNSSNKPGPCRPITTLLNITNTTNQKMYVSCLIEDGGIVFGETSEIQSNIIFKKVA